MTISEQNKSIMCQTENKSGRAGKEIGNNTSKF